jgi:ABC-2 type transport system permease protein
MILAFAAGMLLYFLILLYGAQVMQSVQEEKTNRISEVLVSSIRATHLMLGKVLGVGSVALLQVAIWALFGVLIVTQGGHVVSGLGGGPDVLAMLSFDFDLLIAVPLLLFALRGFFQYAALFAGGGAAAASTEDAQRFTFPLIMPLIIPIVFQQQIISNPHGTVATVLSWLPLTSPIVMPMRMSASMIPAVEVIGALLVLVLGVVVFGWAAGKIYRIGILATGKRPSVRDLVQWLRAA